MDYDIMLGKQVADTTAILDDRPGAFPRDAMHQPQLEVPAISDSAPGLLAIMDRDEGDPDETEEAEPDGLPEAAPADGLPEAAPAGAAAAAAERVRWPADGLHQGMFTFRVIRRTANNGKIVTQWEAECPHHSDPTDASSTKCRKAMQFDDDKSKADVLVKLKWWCLAGRRASCRAANPETSHRHIVIPEKVSAAKVERKFAMALTAPSWLLDKDADPESLSADSSEGSGLVEDGSVPE